MPDAGVGDVVRDRRSRPARRARRGPWHASRSAASHSPACGPSTASRMALIARRGSGDLGKPAAVEREPLQRRSPPRRSAACRPRAPASARSIGTRSGRVSSCSCAAPARSGTFDASTSAEEEEHVLVRRARRRHQVEDRHQRPRRDADLLLAFAPRGVGDVLAALDPAGRHLDQIARAEREMRAEPELADQHDLVALQIDRQDDHDAADPHARRARSSRRPASRDSARSDRSRRRDSRAR